MPKTASLANHIIEEEIARENLRHEITVFMIKRGWRNSTLAEAYGIDTAGVPYDKSHVSHALNGRKKYQKLALRLFEWMKRHEGPRFKEVC